MGQKVDKADGSEIHRLNTGSDHMLSWKRGRLRPLTKACGRERKGVSSDHGYQGSAGGVEHDRTRWPCWVLVKERSTIIGQRLPSISAVWGGIRPTPKTWENASARSGSTWTCPCHKWPRSWGLGSRPMRYSNGRAARPTRLNLIGYGFWSLWDCPQISHA